MADKMNIHWFSNAPWSATGYGNQTRLFVPRLQRAGYGMSITAFYGLDGSILNWSDNIQIYPKGFDLYGQDVLAANTIHSNSDICITLMDAWVCQPDKFQGVKWIPWFPIDSEPVTKINVDKVTQAYKRLVFSRHACKMMDEAGVDYDYIPHGVDTNVYKPIDRKEARKVMELPAEAFIVGMVAANKGFPPRKAFAEHIRAFKMFKDKHKDAILYIHTSDGSRGEGFPFLDYFRMVGLELDKDVYLSSQYQNILGYPDENMNMLYNAFDVHVLVSKGEGFGIPILEAQSAGCPVIVGDWTSMPQLCFGGWKVSREEAEPEYTQYGAHWFVPRAKAIYRKLELSYENSDNQAIRERARKGALAYDADKIVQDYWIPYLDKIAESVKADKFNATHVHQWGAIGLYNKDGSLSTPCLTCNDELKNGIVYKEGFAPLFSSGVKLNLVPDNDGITKIVTREIQRDYQLDNLDLKVGDVVIDIGAHKGIVSCYLAKRYPGVKVYSFEPAESNYNAMLENITRNEIADITPVNMAVTKDGRLVNVLCNEKNSGGAVIYNGAGAEMPTTTLQEIFEKFHLDRVALLKIDCEGSEFEILPGAADILDKVDHLRGEFHAGQGRNVGELLTFVKAHVKDVIVTVQG